MAEERDLVIVGGGPGGYTAAIRATQLGMRVAVVERDRLGGVCGNWGCIPSKSLIHSAHVYEQAKQGEGLGIVPGTLSFDYARMVARSREAANRVSRGVQSLMKKNEIEVIAGEGTLDERGNLRVDGDLVEGKRILLAAGSRERTLPGLRPDPPRVMTSRELLAEETLPTSVAIVGGGAIGVEFAYVLSSLGVEVRMIELAEQLLPGVDVTIAKELEKVFARRGIEVMTGCRFESVKGGADGLRIRLTRGEESDEVAAQRCLVAIGREPFSDGLGLEAAGVATEAGRIVVNERYETTRSRVLAIGDLIDSAQLAHVAAAEGVAAVEILAGRRAPGRMDPRRVPACVYSHPEVATIGFSEAAARDAGHDVSVGTFSYRALGRAVASGETEGLVKLVTDSRYGEVLGCHVLGEAATDMISEVAMTMGLEGTVWDLGRTVHPHPTFAEGIMEAALAAAGEGISA